LPQSRPVRIEIPRIGVRSPLVALGLDSQGAMEVPQDPAVAGWYTLGPTPGALGPAVIAGHVSWNQVPGVFYRLATVRAGDRVRVSREDGTTATFVVTRVATFAKTRFPTRAVFGTTDRAALRLITCGGDYDATAHRFLRNVVAFAHLVRS
jgi:LPXTG-site transpeptidase (sortase) family protein